MPEIGFLVSVIVIVWGFCSLFSGWRKMLDDADQRPPGSADWIRRQKRKKGWSEERARVAWINRQARPVQHPQPLNASEPSSVSVRRSDLPGYQKPLAEMTDEEREQHRYLPRR